MLHWVCGKEIETSFNFLFLFMKKTKNRVGPVVIPMLLNGGSKTENPGLSAKTVVFILPGLTALLKKPIRFPGSESGFWKSRVLRP